MKRMFVLALVLILAAVPMFGGSISYPKGRTKALTAGAATAFVDISLQSNKNVSGTLSYVVEASDGTDYQTRAGVAAFTAVSKAGTITCTIDAADADEVAALSSGTLTNTFTCTAGTGKFTLNSNAASSLTETSLNIRYSNIYLNGPSTATGR